MNQELIEDPTPVKVLSFSGVTCRRSAAPDHKAVGVNQGRRGIAVAALDLFGQLSRPPAVVAVQEGDKLAACFDDAPVLAPDGPRFSCRM